jgi:hypothetical protein
MLTKTVNRFSMTDSPAVGAYMELCDDGEYVKFDDIKHLLQDEPSVPPHSHEGETPVVVADLHPGMAIELGALYIWEPMKPDARCLVKVVEIGETMVCCEPQEGRHRGAKLWNDTSRFLEACVPAVNRR